MCQVKKLVGPMAPFLAGSRLRPARFALTHSMDVIAAIADTFDDPAMAV
jgi:hypothetical protein